MYRIYLLIVVRSGGCSASMSIDRDVVGADDVAAHFTVVAAGVLLRHTQHHQPVLACLDVLVGAAGRGARRGRGGF